jgi:hypothetical protein
MIKKRTTTAGNENVCSISRSLIRGSNKNPVETMREAIAAHMILGME